MPMMIAKLSSGQKTHTGFTLVELAIVLFIITLLLAALVPTLSSQMEQKNRSETRKRLEEIKEALLGYAVVNGRLPCPASPTSNGLESFCTNASPGACGTPLLTYQAHGRCSNPYDGLVPAATLGLSGLNQQGNVLDGWNFPIHYAVTESNGNAFTMNNGISSNFSTLGPTLLVCSAASINGTSCSVANSSLTSSPGVPAVIYSTGANGGTLGAGPDENENPNPDTTNSKVDRIFVSHDNTTDFDDMVVWLSQNTLYNRMISAGKLP